MRLATDSRRGQDLAGDQRVLAWAAVDDGWVVTTHDRLLLPGREPLGWQDVVRAAWDAPVLEVQVPGGLVRWCSTRPGTSGGRQREGEGQRAGPAARRADRGQGRAPGGPAQTGDTAIMWRVTFDARWMRTTPLCGQRPTTPSRSCAPAWDCETYCLRCRHTCPRQRQRPVTSVSNTIRCADTGTQRQPA